MDRCQKCTVYPVQISNGENNRFSMPDTCEVACYEKKTAACELAVCLPKLEPTIKLRASA